MGPLQKRFFGQADFARQLRGRLPLQHPPDDQYHMFRHQLAAREHRATVEVIDPLAEVKEIDGQGTAVIDAEEACFPTRRLAVRAPQTGGMKMLLQPPTTRVSRQRRWLHI